MALFIKRSELQSQLFQVARPLPAADRGFARLVVGLGNIGSSYQDSRHNIGFAVVEALAKQQNFPAWQLKTRLRAEVTEGFVNGTKIIIAKPTTLMNDSGQAVRALKNFYKLANADITIVHDELDLDFGVVKQKLGGSSAGNNGIKSIIAQLGDDFWRLRIGIRSDRLVQQPAADFVLAKFTSTEKNLLPALIKTTLEKLAD